MGFVPFSALIREDSDDDKEELECVGASIDEPATVVVVERKGDRLVFGRELEFTKRLTTAAVSPQPIVGVRPSEHRWYRLEFCYGSNHHSQSEQVGRQIERKFRAARTSDAGSRPQIELSDVERDQLQALVDGAKNEFARAEQWFNFNGYRLMSALYPWHQHWLVSVPIKRTSKRGEADRYAELRKARFARPEDVRAFVESMYDDSQARFGRDPIPYDFFDRVPLRFVASIPDIWWPTDLAPSEPGRRRARRAEYGSGYCLAAIDGDLQAMASDVVKSAPVKRFLGEALDGDYATRSKGVRAALADLGRKGEGLGLEAETLEAERFQRMVETASRKALAGPRNMRSYPQAENPREDGTSWEGHEVGELAVLILRRLIDSIDDRETLQKDPSFKSRGRRRSSVGARSKANGAGERSPSEVDALALVRDERDAWPSFARVIEAGAPIADTPVEEIVEQLGRSMFELVDGTDDIASAGEARDACARAADILRRAPRGEALLERFTMGAREVLECDDPELRDEAERWLACVSRKS